MDYNIVTHTIITSKKFLSITLLAMFSTETLLVTSKYFLFRVVSLFLLEFNKSYFQRHLSVESILLWCNWITFDKLFPVNVFHGWNRKKTYLIKHSCVLISKLVKLYYLKISVSTLDLYNWFKNDFRCKFGRLALIVLEIF